MRTGVLIGALAGAGLIWTGLSAQQETRSAPGFGTGVVKVTGTVEVGNEPAVLAAQRGEWRVAIANTPGVNVANRPTVVVAAPAFVSRNSRYTIIWPTGETDRVTVVDVGASGWIEVEQPGSAKRWLNLGTARSIEEIR